MAKLREPKVELRPDGWGRFERAIDAAVKGGPKHRSSKRGRSRVARNADKNDKKRGD
jgi:hypothetical protein